MGGFLAGASRVEGKGDQAHLRRGEEGVRRRLQEGDQGASQGTRREDQGVAQAQRGETRGPRQEALGAREGQEAAEGSRSPEEDRPPGRLARPSRETVRTDEDAAEKFLTSRIGEGVMSAVIGFGGQHIPGLKMAVLVFLKRQAWKKQLQSSQHTLPLFRQYLMETLI